MVALYKHTVPPSMIDLITIPDVAIADRCRAASIRTFFRLWPVVFLMVQP
jgi:hypothetical protein